MVNNISGNNSINQIYQKKVQAQNLQEKEPQKQAELAPFNSAYVTPFINSSALTPNEKDFVAYRDKFCEVLKAATVEYSKADWEFYINSTPENANTLNIVTQAYGEVFTDKEAYEQFKKFDEKGIKDEHLKDHMQQLLGNFEATLGTSETTDIETSESTEIKETNTDNEPENTDKAMSTSEKEAEISQIFNGFKPKIDGKEVTGAEISDILKNSKDVELRKKAYIAENSSGDAIADKMVELVKMRNQVAKANGYDSYYTMMLNQYGTSEKELFKLLDDLDAKSKTAFEKIQTKSNETVCENFGIKQEEIRPWHKGYLNAASPTKAANEYFTKNNLVPIATEMYTKMGWPINKMPITLDLFPRDNKNGHGFCFGIEAGKDARILANLDGDKGSMETLLHELGHATYTLGIPPTLPVLDQHEASSVTTEAVAMLMESLPEREGTFVDQLKMPEDLHQKLENKRLQGLASFVKGYIFYSQFEKQLYENPDQDVKKLWFDLKQQYTGANPPDELNNEWATVPHFLSHPGYLQNYLRAEVMAAQIYETAHEQLGNLTENKNTAKFFEENIYQYGNSKSEAEVVKIATGKELSAEAFCRQLEKIEV